METRKAVLICIFATILYFTVSDASSAEKILHQTLFVNYSAHVLPVEDTSDKLSVGYTFLITMLMDVDEKTQVVTVHGISKSVWYDYQLQWDPDDYDGLTDIVVPEEWVWKPKTALLNSATGDFYVPTAGVAQIYSNGTVRVVTLATLKFPCTLDIHNFPFDTQRCWAIFSPFLYNADHLVSETLPDDLFSTSIGENTEWTIQGGTSEVIVLQTTYPVENWSNIQVTLIFKRRPLYYMVNIIIPCALMAMMTILVYLLPCDCGEKMSFSVSLLISMSVFNLLVADIMPPTSNSVPLIARYLLFNMVLVSLSILKATIVLRLHHRPKRHLQMAAWVRRVFIDVLPSLLLMEKCKCNTANVVSDINTVQPVFVPTKARKRPSRAEHVDQNLTIMNITYDELDAVEQNNQKKECTSFGVQTFQEMLQEVKEQRKKTEDAEMDDSLLEDWKYVATVIDRFFLWISSIIYFVGTFAMFSGVDFDI